MTQPPPLRPPMPVRKPFPVFKVIAGVVVLAVIGVVALSVLVARAGRGKGGTATTPGAREFRAANEKIISHKDASAFGNTPRARELADEYSKLLKVITEEAFTGGKRGAISLTDGNVLTYCNLTDSSCVFLVHVPELRQYKGEVRDVLAEFAWSAAQDVLIAEQTDPPLRVGVGLRGAVLYGPVMIGKAGEATPARSESGKEELLFPLFVTSAAPPGAPATQP